MTLRAAKDLVRQFEDALDDADDPAAVLRAHLAPDWQVRAVHPFGILTGADEAAERIWQPLKTSFSALRRGGDVFFAGRNEIDGFRGTWVVSMGHLSGLFDAPWLGIPRPDGWRSCGWWNFTALTATGSPKALSSATSPI